MVKNINKFKGKKAEAGITYKEIADELDITEATLRKKLVEPSGEFYLFETIIIKNLLNLSVNEYIDIFFGNELEFNS